MKWRRGESIKRDAIQIHFHCSGLCWISERIMGKVDTGKLSGKSGVTDLVLFPLKRPA